MSKEGLIISILNSKHSLAELFNNKINDQTINDIRRILNRLKDILPKRYRKETKEKLYEIEHNENLSETEKEENDICLRKLVRVLNDKEKEKKKKRKDKEKHCPYDSNDLDYYGVRDTENLFDEVSEEDYYKPILVKSSFKDHYKYYESKGDKEKRLSVRQYLNKILPNLYDLINYHRIARRVWKIQISMHINSISSKVNGQTHTIYVWSDNINITQDSDTDDIIRELFRSFLRNYE